MREITNPRSARNKLIVSIFIALGLGRLVLAADEPTQVPAPIPTADAPKSPAISREDEILSELKKLREQSKIIEDLKSEVSSLRRVQQAQNQEIERLRAGVGAQVPPIPVQPSPPIYGPPTPSPRGNPANVGQMNPALAAPRSDAAAIGAAGARDNVAQPDTLPPSWGPRYSNLRARFGPGFVLDTEDQEFTLQFHNETQVDMRIFGGAPTAFPSSGLYVPRQRFYFMGWLTRPIEYYASINGFFGDFNVLDAFINFHYDDRLMIKVGRFKPPFPYEFYGQSNQDMMAPERSLFAMNFGPGRQVGAMAWGEVFKKKLNYGVAIVNGQRNSYVDYNAGKDVMALVNFKPFLDTEKYPFMKFWSIGGAVDFGIEDNPLIPNGLYTATTFPTNSPNALRASPTFLLFNNNVVERGTRALWSLNTTYFYNHLSVLLGWNSGIDSYGIASNKFNVGLPIESGLVQAGYFITGEKVEGRTQVMPLKPFDLRKRYFGLGAVELTARWCDLSVGKQVFQYGLADPNLWSNSAQMTDVGWNWYLNQFTKIYFDWQHAMYGNPVTNGFDGLRHASSDLFWIRMQIYF